MQTFKPSFFFIPATLLDIIDLHCFISLSLRVKLTAERKTCWHHCLAHFESDKDEIWFDDKQYDLNKLMLLLSEICVIKEITDILLTQLKKKKKSSESCRVFGCLWTSLVQTWYGQIYCWNVYFLWVTLTLIQGHRTEKGKAFKPVISQIRQSI